jgi:hypothetical protein
MFDECPLIVAIGARRCRSRHDWILGIPQGKRVGTYAIGDSIESLTAINFSSIFNLSRQVY